MAPHAHRSTLRLGIALLCVACAGRAPAPAAAARTPQAAVNELLAADRAYSAASARTDGVAGLSAMFAPDVVTPVPGKGFAEGAAKVVESLRANPDNARSRAEWTPVRGGISADGGHGFTFGYMTVQRPDSAPLPLKYLAYWVRRPEGWRVAVYKRARRAEGEISLAPMAPALPPRMVRPSGDAASAARFRESLDRAEREFSASAQRIGIGPAFVQYGSADAINLGGPRDVGFVVGSEAIGRLVAEGAPPNGSPVSWAPDRVIAASSGDFGVTIGTIRPNAPAANGASATGFPFFTIWRRASRRDPWRYVAE